MNLNSRGKLLLKLLYSNRPSLLELLLLAQQSGRLVDTFRHCSLDEAYDCLLFAFILPLPLPVWVSTKALISPSVRCILGL